MVKLLISFTLVLLFTCFFVSSQNISPISSRDILSQHQNITSQDRSYIYEEPIEGLSLYDTNADAEGSLLIWMAFENKENECILPYVYLRSIDRTGQIKYIDLNYTFPAETVCPKIDIEVFPLTYNYILITYVKTINGVKERYGLIINYDSEIMG